MDKELEQGVRRKADTVNATCNVGSLVAGAVQETQEITGSIPGSDLLEEEAAAHCSNACLGNPWYSAIDYILGLQSWWQHTGISKIP